jgi:hypothetical protein
MTQHIKRFEVPLGMLGGTLVVLAFVFAATGIPSWIPAALSLRFGVPSPLTGMTRSFVALVSGDVRGAFIWHPLGPFAFAACLAMPVVAVVSWRRERRFRVVATVLQSRIVWIIGVAVIALVWARQIVALG